MKQLTLSYLLRDDGICLALKKRGFGEGNWNGFGGKLHDGETITEGAVREIEEECCVGVKESDLEKVAVVEFIFEDGAYLEVHTFFTRIWNGEPEETDEMKPQWFSYDQIPYDHMWKDDEHWLPRALAGEKLRGKVWFDHTNTDIKEMQWRQVRDFS